MALTIGSQADIKLLNVTVQEFSPDNSWVRVSLQPDPVTGDVVDIWLPSDTRTVQTPSLPANWPPQEGDIWFVNGTTPVIRGAIMLGTDGTTYFVVPDNIHNKSAPMTTDEALAQWGSSLQLVTRLPVTP